MLTNNIIGVIKRKKRTYTEEEVKVYYEKLISEASEREQQIFQEDLDNYFNNNIPVLMYTHKDLINGVYKVYKFLSDGTVETSEMCVRYA